MSRILKLFSQLQPATKLCVVLLILLFSAGCAPKKEGSDDSSTNSKDLVSSVNPVSPSDPEATPGSTFAALSEHNANFRCNFQSATAQTKVPLTRYSRHEHPQEEDRILRLYTHDVIQKGNLKETLRITTQDVVYKENQLRSASSDLIIQVPEALAGEIPEDVLKQTYVLTEKTPTCRKSNQTPIDLVLAQTCLIYQESYLFSENLPDNLDLLLTAEDYVLYAQKKDPYTFYYAAQQFNDEVLPSLKGERAGIGLRVEAEGVLTLIRASSTVVTINSNNPLMITGRRLFSHGWFDGFQKEDQIMKIDNTSIEGLTFEQIALLFPHLEEQTGVIEVKRNNTLLSIKTTAAEHLSCVTSEGIAYLNARQFTTETGVRIKEHFDYLTANSSTPITKLLFDLRYNGGGSTSGARALVDYLIDRDTPAKTHPLMIIDGKVTKNQTYYLGDYSPNNIGDFSPQTFVVLMNEGSASSSEITLNALKDYKIATLLGAKSYGKGVQQFVYTLFDNSGVFVTADYFYSPLRNTHHGIGIMPDICIDSDILTISPNNDPQLAAAMQWLTQGQVTNGSVCPEETVHTSLVRDPLLQVFQERSF
ncbi:S41 family peptidase [Deltaproteobacteria bacterium TL4]